VKHLFFKNTSLWNTCFSKHKIMKQDFFKTPVYKIRLFQNTRLWNA